MILGEGDAFDDTKRLENISARKERHLLSMQPYVAGGPRIRGAAAPRTPSVHPYNSACLLLCGSRDRSPEPTLNRPLHAKVESEGIDICEEHAGCGCFRCGESLVLLHRR